jgi:hypothetical protein
VVLAPILIAVLPSLSVAGLSDPELLARAESAFAEGLSVREQPSLARPLFRAAAEAYGQLRDRGIRNTDLLTNEGNAWLLADDLPRAIFAYRLGLRLAPADRILQGSLTFAREQVVYASSGGFGRPPTNNRPPWLPRIGLSAWSFGLLSVLYALSWGYVTRWWMVRRPRLLGMGLSGFALVALAVGLLAAGSYYESRTDTGPLVVLTRDRVLLRKGNGMAYPPRNQTPLNRGVEARLLFRRGDWVQIELSGGEVGWVPVTAVLIEPTGEPGEPGA